ncbi:MAG: DEAD/DEAH box helicase [Sphingomonadales bacterium]|nr:DEAD/DEAH box helicase [Sphingomonadales bacterium]MDE2168870.1 DEAD/DEAH box helicase [Sphingomonadales bacterium]
MPFSSLPQSVADALAAKGYEAPTPVQAACMGEEAQGRDLLVSAQTGSGKTVAFGLAMAPALLGEGDRLPHAGKPLALVIAPTRELALQVSRELEWLFAKANARIATCVGGMDPSRERRTLSHGAHIVVGTPGRLRDHLERGALDLSSLQFAVLDEADEMLDMGFREDLEQILDGTPEGRRTLLFSATMPAPIAALARQYQHNALRISTIDTRESHSDITYNAVAVSPSDIEHAVVNLLRFHEAETAMLFCATRDNVRHLHATLVERGFAAVALSGEHSQSERNHALQALRDGRARVCVATDVAARGIDVATLSLVIHVELPRDAETLQHRSGRTGRAGRKGTAVLVVPYPRRRRMEMLLRSARIAVEWVPVPSAEAIRANDHDRLLATLLEPVEASEEDNTLAQALLAQRTPQEIAAALVRAHRARLPQPEEMIESSPAERSGRREGFDDVVWFRMDIGRRQNADPRWLLPLLCRRGHITRGEIGAIRIGANETHFQVPRNAEARFREALAKTAREGAEDESGIRIEPSPDAPREVAKRNARHGNEGGPQGERRPHRKGPREGGHGGQGGYQGKPKQRY